MFERLRAWRRKRRIAAVIIPEDLWVRAEAQLPFLAFLPPEDRPRLRELARAFIAEKEFHGAAGLELNNDIIVGVSLQACLPILNIGLEAYRGWVGVVVYPGDFVISRSVTDEDGVVHEYDDEVLGEAWEGGPVLVSWHGEDERPEGVNVVIHEFAHKLDMVNGEVDGLPLLRPGMSRTAWARTFGEAYAGFCDAVDAGEDTVLDPYASEDPGEFFAVASEVFFENPVGLRSAMPEIYRQLSQFYGLDPAAHAARSSDI